MDFSLIYKITQVRIIKQCNFYLAALQGSALLKYLPDNRGEFLPFWDYQVSTQSLCYEDHVGGQTPAVLENDSRVTNCLHSTLSFTDRYRVRYFWGRVSYFNQSEVVQYLDDFPYPRPTPHDLKA